MTDRLIQTAKVVTLLSPAADRFTGTVTSNSVNMRDSNVLTALICRGAVASGTTVVTVQSSADSAAGSPTAIPFRVKKPTASTQDAYADEINVTNSGYTLTAELDNLIDIIEVDDSDLDGTDKYVSLKFVEGVDHPMLVGVVGILTGGRQQGDGKRTVRA